MLSAAAAASQHYFVIIALNRSHTYIHIWTVVKDVLWRIYYGELFVIVMFNGTTYSWKSSPKWFICWSFSLCTPVSKSTKTKKYWKTISKSSSNSNSNRIQEEMMTEKNRDEWNRRHRKRDKWRKIQRTKKRIRLRAKKGITKELNANSELLKWKTIGATLNGKMLLFSVAKCVSNVWDVETFSLVVFGKAKRYCHKNTFLQIDQIPHKNIQNANFSEKIALQPNSDTFKCILYTFCVSIYLIQFLENLDMFD